MLFVVAAYRFSTADVVTVFDHIRRFDPVVVSELKPSKALSAWLDLACLRLDNEPRKKFHVLLLIHPPKCDLAFA